jgi:hypothetical protein
VRRRLGLLGAIALAIATPVAAQPRDSAATRVAAFVEQARRATERFKDISVAVAESYLKLGPDFPGMGEHWVNGELIMRAELNPARPAILTYATIDGKPTLTGAVYALSLGARDAPPELFPGAQWHDHVGSVDEESLLFGHHRMSGSDDLRLVVMHAWLWLDNPAGMFATDNWALPFARLGLSPPADAGDASGRALSLISGGDAFHAKLFTAAADLSDSESRAVARVLERHRVSLEAWWNARDPALSPSALLPHLDSTWQQVQTDVARSVSRDARRRLARLHQ